MIEALIAIAAQGLIIVHEGPSPSAVAHVCDDALYLVPCAVTHFIPFDSPDDCRAELPEITKDLLPYIPKGRGLKVTARCYIDEGEDGDST